MKLRIDLQERFKEETCTFEMAKKVSGKGMTCANVYLSYDENGQVGDGAWLQSISKEFISYPAIHFSFAVLMLSGLPDFDKIEVYEISTYPETYPLPKRSYQVKYRDEDFIMKNIVDALLELWCKFAPDVKK